MSFEELKQTFYKETNEVYQIFKDFFGEQYVDLQNTWSDTLLLTKFDNYKVGIDNYDISTASLRSLQYYCSMNIMVWWPNVTITNELDRSVNIQDLYAIVPINARGFCIGKFQLNRTTYTEKQFRGGYVHSHVPRMKYGSLHSFLNPCLGSGPIQDTIETLAGPNDNTLWMLFCQELDNYVRVESLAGVPYYKLETIGNSSKTNVSDFNLKFSYAPIEEFCSMLSKETVKDFFKYCLKTVPFKYSFSHGSFSIGMTFPEYCISMSNAFIEYYNSKGIASQALTDHLYLNKIIRSVCFDGVKLFKDSNLSHDPDDYQDLPLFKFKGQMQKLKIIKSNQQEVPPVTILDPNICMFFYYCILKVVNYKFSNHANRNQAADTASISQKVRYI